MGNGFLSCSFTNLSNFLSSVRSSLSHSFVVLQHWHIGMSLIKSPGYPVLVSNYHQNCFFSGSYQPLNQIHHWLCTHCFTWCCPITIQSPNKRYWCLKNVLTGKMQRRKCRNQLGQCGRRISNFLWGKLRGHSSHGLCKIPTPDPTHCFINEFPGYWRTMLMPMLRPSVYILHRGQALQKCYTITAVKLLNEGFCWCNLLSLTNRCCPNYL